MASPACTSCRPARPAARPGAPAPRATSAGGRPRREAGAQASGEPPPDVLGALRRFGRMAAAEVEAVCELPGPRASAELWRLAADWRVKQTRFLTGELWELV